MREWNIFKSILKHLCIFLKYIQLIVKVFMDAIFFVRLRKGIKSQGLNVSFIRRLELCKRFTDKCEIRVIGFHLLRHECVCVRSLTDVSAPVFGHTRIRIIKNVITVFMPRTVKVTVARRRTVALSLFTKRGVTCIL